MCIVFLVKLSLKFNNLLLILLIANLVHMPRHIQFILHISKLVVERLYPFVLALDLSSKTIGFILSLHKLDIALAKLRLEILDLSLKFADLVIFSLHFNPKLLFGSLLRRLL